MGATFNPFIETVRTYIRYVAKESIKHPSFKSDLVMGMPSFDYSTLFILPRPKLLNVIVIYSKALVPVDGWREN